uniref:ANAPC4_WD40 domain-containing protein n=1 Tax=Parastrongyloides trichosuri TaxID=131310 RepID=A0A0N4ZH00_PARTI
MKLLFRLSEEENGTGNVLCRWRPEGNYLAVAGSNSSIRIYDKSGKIIDEFSLEGGTNNLEWDKSGNILALTTINSPFITLWDLSSRKVDRLDCSIGSKENPSFICWSDEHPLLAIGNNRGNLLLYDHQTSKKISIFGKHQRAIISGCFTEDNLLALSSEDSSISISNVDGENLACLICNSPVEMVKSHKFKKLRDESKPKNADESEYEMYISGVISSKTIILINSNDLENPINLQFQQKYGDISSYLWFVDGCILLGFVSGHIICISAQTSEIGQELFSMQDFKTTLNDLHLCFPTNELLLLGDSHMKIRNVDNIGDLIDIQELDFDTKGLSTISTNYDGQFICVTGLNGSVVVYLLKLPILGAAYKESSVILSSLTEVTVNLNSQSTTDTVKFPIKLEPNFIAISSKFIAVAMNNRAWYYTYNRKGGELRAEFEYMASILDLKISDEYAVAKIAGGKAQLHRIINDLDSRDIKSQSLIFPEYSDSNIKRIKKTNDVEIECIDISERFFIFATNNYEIKHFSLKEWTIVNEYNHSCGIKWISSEIDGLRLCFFDDRVQTYLYSPLNNKLTSFNSSSSLKANYKNCLWENFTIDKDSLVTFDDYTFHVYIIERKEGIGYELVSIGTQKIPYGMTPLLLNKGVVTCLTSTGKISSVLLDTFKMDMVVDKKSIPEIEKILEQTLILKR